MRARGRTDSNQSRLVKSLRQLGVRVEILSSLGNGVADLLCAPKHGPMVLLEVKDGSKSKSRQALTGPEKEWHSLWHEHVFTVNSLEQAIKVLNLLT